jgi:hypothetical protein
MNVCKLAECEVSYVFHKLLVCDALSMSTNRYLNAVGVLYITLQLVTRKTK